MITADIVEVQVDTFRRRGGQPPDQVGAIVDTFIEAQFVNQQPCFVGSAGTADDARRAEQTGELPGRAADGAARRRDEHDVAVAQFARPPQPHVGGEAGLAEHAEPGRQRGETWIHDGGSGCVDDRPIAPAEPVPNITTRRDAIGPAGNDPSDGGAVESAADREVGGVVLFRRLHAPAHRRIDTHVDVANQQLTRLKFGEELLLEPEIRRRRPPARARGKGHDPSGRRDRLDGHARTSWRPRPTLYCRRSPTEGVSECLH